MMISINTSNKYQSQAKLTNTPQNKNCWYRCNCCRYCMSKLRWSWLIFYEDTSSILLLQQSTSNWHLHQCGSGGWKSFSDPSALFFSKRRALCCFCRSSSLVLPIPFLLLPFTPKPNTQGEVNLTCYYVKSLI